MITEITAIKDLREADAKYITKRHASNLLHDKQIWILVARRLEAAICNGWCDTRVILSSQRTESYINTAHANWTRGEKLQDVEILRIK